MPAPFKFSAMSKTAEELADKLLTCDEFCEDVWADEILGPILRVYVLITYMPEAAFSKEPTDEYRAECRFYAYARMARIHAKRDGCECMEIDGMDDLWTEYDSLVDADLIGALKAAHADAQRQLTKLKKSGDSSRMKH